MQEKSDMETAAGIENGEYRAYLATATKQAGFYFIGKLCGSGLGFLTGFLAGRLLGPDDYGVFGLANTIVFFLTLLALFGLDNGMVRFLPSHLSRGEMEEGRGKLLFALTFVVISGACLTVLLIAGRTFVAASIFKKPELEQPLLWMSLSIVPFVLLYFFSYLLRALKEVGKEALGFEVVQKGVKLLLFLFCFWIGMRLSGIVLAFVISMVAAAVVSGWMVFPRLREYFRGVKKKAAKKGELLSYSGTMFLSGLLWMVIIWIDRVVIGIRAESADVGIYLMALLFANLIMMVFMSFSAIFSPIISDLYQRKKMETLQQIFRSLTRWVCIATVPVFSWIVMFREAALGLAGDKYSEGASALLVMAVALMLFSAGSTVEQMLYMSRHHKTYLVNAFIVATLSATGNWILVKPLGILGAAIATGGAMVLIKIIMVIQVRVFLGFFPYDWKIVKVVANLVLTFGFVIGLREIFVSNGLFVVVATFSLTCLFSGLLVLLMRIEEEDRFVLETIGAKMGIIRKKND